MSSLASLHSEPVASRDQAAAQVDRQPLGRLGAGAGVLLVGAVIASGWLFGGVWAVTQAGALLASAVALVMLVLAAWSAPRSRLYLPTALLPLLGGLLLALGQLLPLPADWAARLSPQAASLRGELAVALEPTESNETAPLSLYPGSTRRELARLVLAVSAFVVGAGVFCRRQPANWLFVALAINGAALGFFGIVQQLSWNGALYWCVPLSDGGAPFGSFVNRNNAGGYLNLGLAAALGLLVWVHARREEEGEQAAGRNEAVIERLRRFLAELTAARLFSIAAVGCLVAGVLCSLSRGAIVAMVVATAVTVVALALATRRLGPALLVSAAMLAGIALVAWGGKADKVEDRLATLVDPTHGGDFRLPHWQDSLQAAPNFWTVGSGLGTYRYVYRLYERGLTTKWFYHAENQYVEALVEGGAPGLGLLLLAIGLVAAALVYLFRHDSQAACPAAVVGTFALTSQMVSGSFDFGLYLPANMLLLALVCGAVTGRAALLATERGQARWLALPSFAPLAPLVAIALAVCAGFGFFELRRAAEWERQIAALAPATDSTDSNEAASVATLEQLAAVAPLDDAEAQRQLAHLWIARYRHLTLVELRRQTPAEVPTRELQPFTQTAQLHRAGHQLLAADDADAAASLAALRAQPAVVETLLPAVRHLRQAVRACPLVAEVYLELARLALATGLAMDEAPLVQCALRTAPRNARVLFHAGLLDWQAGRTARGVESWRESLLISPRYEEPILREATARLKFNRVLKDLLPADPERLVAIAQRRFGQAEMAVQRYLVLGHAQRVALATTELSDEERAYWQARIQLALDRPAAALPHLAEAVRLRPDDHAWRFAYAQLLLRQGDWREAEVQAQLCLLQTPRRGEYQQLIEKIQIRRAGAERAR